ncbi:MAG TPA: hypothetical protein DEG71_08785 [Clostridiales bacterium]|nr:hypothetical protein [Clostridiales bacterium]
MSLTMQEYFNQTVQKVLTSIKCTLNISITIMDHETLKDKAKHALGICWETEKGYYITIDEFFVEECYKYFELDTFSTWVLGSGWTLEHVICHELAHTQIWRHGKKHTELTNRLLSKVKLPEKYYEYLHKKYREIS